VVCDFQVPPILSIYFNAYSNSFGHIKVIEEEELEKKAQQDAQLHAKREAEKLKRKNEIVPDGNIMSQLLSMGCSGGGSKKACIAVKNSGVDAAMDYYFSHSEDPGFNDDDDHEEEDNIKGGDSESRKTANEKSKKAKVKRTVLELQRLFTQLQFAEQRSMSTDLLTTKGFNFKSGDASVQHDVQELIVMLLDKLDHELGGGNKKNSSNNKKPESSGAKLIPQLFELTSRTQLECLTCGTTSGPPPETNKNFFVPVKAFLTLIYIYVFHHINFYSLDVLCATNFSPIHNCFS
jgi:uncharacterized UBP type Zn finger protein